MKQLTIQNSPEGIAALDAAWDAPESFMVLPVKHAGDQVPDAGLIPAACSEHHFVLLTSGSTGSPKLIVARRDRSENLARVMHDKQALEEVENTILLLPLHYSYAFVNQWLWSRVHGRPLIPVDGFRSSEEVLHALSEHRKSMICLVGAMVPMLLGALGDQVMEHVLRINFAGGRFPADQLSELRTHFPNARFFNNYGCAEAMPRLTIREEASPESPADPGWLGDALPGIELDVQDGHLVFRSAYAAVGYVDDNSWHAIAPDDWVGTGDLAERDTERGGWRLQGRTGDVFKRYGEKVALPALLRLAEGSWTRGVGAYRDQDEQGEDGYVLVLGGGAGKPEARTLLGVFRDQVSRIQWPLRVESMAELPLLPNGKADSSALVDHAGKTVLWTQRI